jgi:hypothetical protein
MNEKSGFEKIIFSGACLSEKGLGYVRSEFKERMKQ